MKRNMLHVQVCCVAVFQMVVCLGALSRHNCKYKSVKDKFLFIEIV